MILLQITAVFAQDLSFQASVNKTQVALNESLLLTLTVLGSKESIDPINLPTIDGFESKYLGPSTSISITNGSYDSQRRFIYQLVPLKVGQFKIPSITTTISGQTLTTSEINLTVDDVKPSSTTSPASDSSGNPTLDLKDKIKFSIEASKQDVYINEPIELILKLYITGVQIRNIQFPQMNQDGLEVGVLNHQQYQQLLNGINYNIIEFKTTIYPKKVGDLPLGPAQINSSMIEEQQRQDDFFQSLFNTYATRPVTATSNALVLHVKELPLQGKPADFSSAVGNFDFNMTASPTTLKVGDPITVRIAVTGNGAFKNIVLPQITDAHFKTYEPKVTFDEKSKTVEQVIIPISEQAVEIPALTFNYFDTTTQEYRTLTQGPIPLTVTAPTHTEEFKAIGFNDLSKGETGAQPLISENMLPALGEKIMKATVALFKQWWFWLSGIMLVLGVGAWMIWRSYERRLKHDTAFSRRTYAYKNAQGGLSKAKSIIIQEQPKLFYDVLDKTLTTYVADCVHVPTHSLNHRQVIDFITSKKVNQDQVSALENVLQRSETVRFALTGITQDQMMKDYDVIVKIIATIDKK